jgi:sulfur carrier protein
MEINFNGTREQASEFKFLADLLELKGFISKTGIAVAVNQKVVPRGEWVKYPVAENDSILVIKATQGG